MQVVKRGPNGGAILRDDDGSEFESAHPVALHALDHLEGKCALCSGGVAGHMAEGGVADSEPKDPDPGAPGGYPDDHPPGVEDYRGTSETHEQAKARVQSQLDKPVTYAYGKGPTLAQVEQSRPIGNAKKATTTETSEASAPAATQIGPDAGMKDGGVVGKPPAGMSEEDFAAAQAASNASPDASAPPASTFDSQQVAAQASGETGVDDSIALLNAEQPSQASGEAPPSGEVQDVTATEPPAIVAPAAADDSAPSDGATEVPPKGVNPPAPDAVHTVPAENQSDAKKAYFQAYADKVAAATGVPPARLKAHLDWESGHTWDPNFVSAPNKDGTHDAGLGSFNDGGTAQKYGLIDKDGDHRHDPLRAIRATALKLADDAGPEKDWDKASRMYNGVHKDGTPVDPTYLPNILATEKRFGGSGVTTQTQDGQVAGEQVGEPAPEQPEGETPMPPPLETPPGAPGGGETAEAQALDPNAVPPLPPSMSFRDIVRDVGNVFSNPHANTSPETMTNQPPAPVTKTSDGGAAADTDEGGPTEGTQLHQFANAQPTALEKAQGWLTPDLTTEHEQAQDVQRLGNREADLQEPRGEIASKEAADQADLLNHTNEELAKRQSTDPADIQAVNDYYQGMVKDAYDKFKATNTDPNAIWRNAGAGSKFLQVLGSVLGGIKQGLVGGDNPAETHLNNFINQEAEHIKNQMQLGKESVGAAGDLWKQHLRALGDKDSATAALRANIREEAAQKFDALALTAKSADAKLAASQSALAMRQAAVFEYQRAALGGNQNRIQSLQVYKGNLETQMAPYAAAPEIAAQSFDAKLRAATSGQQTQPFTTEELMAGRARLGGALDKDPETDEAGYYTRGAPPPADKERITYAGAATSGIRAAVAGIRAGHEAGFPYTEDRGSWHIRMRHIEENMAKAHGIELRGEALDDQTDKDFPYTNSPVVTALPFLMDHLADMQNTKRGIQGSHGWQANPALRPLVPGSR